MSPAPDQIEVTLLGPGYGECAVIHLGNGNWIVVDSCIDSSTHQPAAISYLEDLGLDPLNAVKMIIATHWHDDHIGGMGALVSRCAKAKFCCSSALGRGEFLGLVRKFEKGSRIEGGSGVREINQVFEILIGRNGEATPAIQNKRVLRLGSSDSGHGQECEVWTLSPSDMQYQKFLFELTSLMPQVREPKYRCPAQPPNDLSVVSWVKIGELAILLGGDLEETTEEESGWSVIVASAERPSGLTPTFGALFWQRR